MTCCAGCSLAIARVVPDGAGEGSRFLALAEGAAVDCGAHIAQIPPVGRLPPIDDGLLFELDADGFRARFDDGAAIDVFRIDRFHPYREAGLVDLPAPIRVWRAAGGGFARIDTASAAVALASVRALASDRVECADAVKALCGATTPCTNLASHDVPLPGEPNLLIPLDDTTLLTNNSTVELVVVRAEGIVSRQKIPPGVPADAAVRAPDRRTWYYGYAGLLAFGSLEAGFTSLPSFPAAKRSNFTGSIDGTFTSTAIDLIVSSADKDVGSVIVGRFDGSAWTDVPIADLNCLPYFAFSEGLGRGRVFCETSEITVLGGSAAIQRLPIGGSVPRSVVRVHGFGYVMGTSAGELYVSALPGAPWRRLDAPNEGFDIVSIVPFESGFLFAPSQSLGTQVQYVPGFGSCPGQSVLPAYAHHAVAMGEGVVIASHHDPSWYMSFVGRAHPYPRCR
jgi:hypothetical protein